MYLKAKRSLPLGIAGDLSQMHTISNDCLPLTWPSSSHPYSKAYPTNQPHPARLRRVAPWALHEPSLFQLNAGSQLVDVCLVLAGGRWCCSWSILVAVGWLDSCLFVFHHNCPFSVQCFLIFNDVACKWLVEALTQTLRGRLHQVGTSQNPQKIVL